MQPDSIIPNAGNPQAWNRFSYVNNSPIDFNDPTGHAYCDFINNQNKEDCTGGESRIATSGSSGGNSGGGNNNDDDIIHHGGGAGNEGTTLTQITNGTQSTLDDASSNPDYFSLNGCYFVICGQVVRDYYNNWYWGLGPGISSGLSVSLNAGRLLQTGRSEDAIQNFTLESTVFGGGVFPLAGPLGIGPAVTWGDPSLTRPFDYHDLSVEVQVGNAGAAGGYLYDFWIYDSGDPTPWFWQGNDGVNNINP